MATAEKEVVPLKTGEDEDASAPKRLSRGGSGKPKGSKSNLASSSRMGSLNNLSKEGRSSLSNNLAAAATSVAPPPAPASNAIIYENTYKTKPDLKFGAGKVTTIIKSTLNKILTGKKYEAEQVPELITTISNEILAEVKKLNYERYKIVVQVDIGEFKGQGIKIASRSVWDTTTDTWASGSFKNATLFAVAMVFGCYFE